MDIQQTIDYCLSLNYDKLEEFAKINYQKLYDYLKTKQSSERVKTVLEGSIFTFVSANGELADEEFKFIQNILGEYSYESLIEITKEYFSSDAQETARRLYSVLNEETKKAYINLCIAVLAVDKNIDISEDFLINLIKSDENY